MAGALEAFGAEVGPTSIAPIGVREFRYTTVDMSITPPGTGPLMVGMRYNLGAHSEDLEFELERQLDSVHYLGPLREASDRLYVWSGDAPTDVGFLGENTVAALLAARGRLLQMEDSREPVRFEELLASWLVRTGLLESFEAKSIESETGLYRVMVRTPDSRRLVNLVDVGFGVSQVLPVLVQLLYT